MSPQTYEAFEREYEHIRKFGLKALKNEFDIKKNSRLGIKKEADVLSFVKRAIVSPTIDNRLNDAFVKDLDRVRQLQRLVLTPRGDEDFELTANSKQSVENSPSFKMPSWTKKMDLTSDPKFRKAIKNIAQNPDMNQKELTNQFDMVMNAFKNKLKNEYKNRLAMKMAPKPGRRPRPEP